MRNFFTEDFCKMFQFKVIVPDTSVQYLRATRRIEKLHRDPAERHVCSGDISNMLVTLYKSPEKTLHEGVCPRCSCKVPLPEVHENLPQLRQEVSVCKDRVQDLSKIPSHYFFFPQNMPFNVCVQETCRNNIPGNVFACKFLMQDLCVFFRGKIKRPSKLFKGIANIFATFVRGGPQKDS